MGLGFKLNPLMSDVRVPRGRSVRQGHGVAVGLAHKLGMGKGVDSGRFPGEMV